MFKWLGNLLFNVILMWIWLSFIFVSNRDIIYMFINVGDTETILSIVRRIVLEFIHVLVVVYDSQIICNNYLSGYPLILTVVVINWIKQMLILRYDYTLNKMECKHVILLENCRGSINGINSE